MIIERDGHKMSGNKNIISKMGKIHWGVWLGLIIIFAVLRLVFLFSLRDGHHVDETWSYGFANSYYNPQIYYDFDENIKQNNGMWITGDTFKDYITVSEDHRFSFDSVLFNKRVDLSPPLYELLLHFVCSLFPNTFSWWYAFSISLFCYIPSLIFIYLISFEITNSKFCGYLTLIYYIFSGCGTANFLYLRIYHLFTLFTLTLFCLLTKIIKGNVKKIIPYYFLLLIPSILGYLTHYYFLVIAFAFTFFSAIALLIKKRWRGFFCLCGLMFFSVIVFFAVYPPALRLLIPYSTGDTSGTGYYTYPYYFDLGVANARFFTGTIGFFINITLIDIISVLGALFFVLCIVSLIYFLFRNEQWMKNIKTKVGFFIKRMIDLLVSFIKKFDCSLFVALFSVLMYLFIIPYSATLTNMGFTERYFFSTMSLFVVIYISVVANIIRSIFEKYRAKKFIVIPFILLIFAVLVFQNIKSDTMTRMFRFDNMRDKDFEDMVKGRDCYVVVKYGRDLVWLSTVLADSSNVYVEYQEDVMQDEYLYPLLDEDCLFVLVREGLMTEEQQSEYEEDLNIVLNGYTIPDTNKTIDQIQSEISNATGYTYELKDEYPSFIGMVNVYESNGDADH